MWEGHWLVTGKQEYVAKQSLNIRLITLAMFLKGKEVFHTSSTTVVLRDRFFRNLLKKMRCPLFLVGIKNVDLIHCVLSEEGFYSFIRLPKYRRSYKSYKNILESIRQNYANLLKGKLAHFIVTINKVSTVESLGIIGFKICHDTDYIFNRCK